MKSCNKCKHRYIDANCTLLCHLWFYADKVLLKTNDRYALSQPTTKVHIGLNIIMYNLFILKINLKKFQLHSFYIMPNNSCIFNAKVYMEN